MVVSGVLLLIMITPPWRGVCVEDAARVDPLALNTNVARSDTSAAPFPMRPRRPGHPDFGWTIAISSRMELCRVRDWSAALIHDCRPEMDISAASGRVTVQC